MKVYIFCCLQQKNLLNLLNFNSFVDSLLADIFNLGDYKIDFRAGILADLYYYTIQYPFMTCSSHLIVSTKLILHMSYFLSYTRRENADEFLLCRFIQPNKMCAARYKNQDIRNHSIINHVDRQSFISITDLSEHSKQY